MTDPTARKPSMGEFVREVIVAMRGAGLEGDVQHDAARATLQHAERGSFDLTNTYAQFSTLPAAKRTDALAKLARLWIHPPALPTTWEEASKRVLPHIRTRMSSVEEDARRQAAGTVMPTPRAEFTPHLVFEIVVPVEGATLTVAMEALTNWGVDMETAFRTAIKNLASRSDAQWLGSPEAPGVYASPWRDGFDACRVSLPLVFTRVPLHGRPVVVAPTPSQMLFAGSDDTDGLFHMARMARRSLEANKAFHFLRAIRMGDDGESWEDWIPPKDHPAYDPLRLLRGVQEVHEYDKQVALVRQFAPKDQDVIPMPRLHLVESDFGAQSLTVTVWRSGKPSALPKADAIIFQRDDEVLGFAPWEQVTKALRGSLRPTPGYPTRYMAADFPEGWQVGMLDLKPWRGRLP